ncbi:MAG TPA: MFS transporter [Candidatus Binatia bacterium]|nr:MFS transporter [Candidatus Binatia bacterium]
MTTEKPESIWTRAFAFLCLAEFLGYAQHFILQPTFPLYITQLGGSPFHVGLVIASFGVTSVMSRPIIGYWADRWSVTGVMILGLFLQTLSISLCFVPFVGALMFANGLRGIGWSGMNTGGYTLLATSAPPTRRGEASGCYGGVQSSATILFPAVALWILNAPSGGFGATFLLAMTLVLLGAGAAIALSREVPRAPRTIVAGSPETWWREILSVFDRNIVLAAALLVTLHVSLPCFTSFVVLYARQLSIDHFGWYFVVTGITSMLARPLLGRLSDKIGAGRSLIVAFTLESAALLLMPFVSNLAGVMLGGALYFMGSAIGGTRILALAMERAPAERRGRAMASFSVAFPLSNGTGALLSGLVVDLAGYDWMYITAAVPCAVGVILTAQNWRSLK